MIKIIAAILVAGLTAATSGHALAQNKPQTKKYTQPCSTYCAAKYGHSASEKAQCLAYRGKCDHSR